MRLSLDSADLHSLTWDRQPHGGWVISLRHSEADRRSVLHAAFRRHLRVRAGTWEAALDPTTDALTLPASTEGCEILLGEHPPHRLARCILGAAPHLVGDTYRLSPFEARFLAETGHPHPCSQVTPEKPLGLTTDLHTHFAGCLRPAALVELGLQAGLAYPPRLLEEAGIRVEGTDPVPLTLLPAAHRERLKRDLAISLDRQVPFPELERIYRLRSPITKAASVFPALLRRIAEDYRAMGIRYAELSLSNVIEAQRLRLLHRELPALEAEIGVRLRFLAALSRHNDLEWDLDCLDRLRELTGSRYLVGLDFMGHETNSTRVFARQLREAAEWADRERPGFVLRVHAGENPAYPDNVRVAVETVAGLRVRLRIGHGLYGVDTETLALLRQSGAIVEFNLNSNFALNNIQSAREVPLARYLAAGVRVVLGTDGYGIYLTDAGLEVRAARLAGLTDADLERIRETEQAYRATQDELERTLPEDFAVPDDPPQRHYTPAVTRRRAGLRAEQETQLRAALVRLNVPLVGSAELRDLLRDRLILSFAGAWLKSWQTVAPAHRELIRREVALLLDGLDPVATVLVTGGTHFGVEHVVQELARPRGFPVLGALVRTTPPESLAAGAITHATLVGDTLYDKAAGLYRLLREVDGYCLFIGGGSIVNDEIQAASNLRLRYLLMDGPEGASSRHARLQPERAFSTAAEILPLLRDRTQWDSTPDPYWHRGPNPTVDLVLVRRSPGAGALEVLLIRRDPDAPAEPGKWALPGGFPLTDACRGTPWEPGRETLREACLRELLEETGLDLVGSEAELLQVGVYEGGGRDPRDTPEAWSCTHVFAHALPAALAPLPLAGGDDAAEARWHPLSALPAPLAFDHARLLRDGLQRLAELEVGEPSQHPDPAP